MPAGNYLAMRGLREEMKALLEVLLEQREMEMQLLLPTTYEIWLRQVWRLCGQGLSRG
jgi:hypothetical protein